MELIHTYSDYKSELLELSDYKSELSELWSCNGKQCANYHIFFAGDRRDPFDSLIFT